MLKKVLKKIKYEIRFQNTNYYVRASDKLSKIYYQWLLYKKIKSLNPIVLNCVKSRFTLAILADKKRFYESVASLYSFCFWEKEITVHYHEDGTLTHKEFNYLEATFPGIVIFKRSEQNLKVENHLLSKGLKDCAQLRKHFIFAIRLFDMIIEKKTTYLLQIDSDILFFSKPKEILDIPQNCNLNGCYNRDVSNSYTFDEKTIKKYIKALVISKFNAGVFLHNFDDSFFNFAENILEKEPQATTSWHLEQTLFAMYVSKKGSFLGLPKYYDLARKERDMGNKIVSEHYVQGAACDFHKDFIYKLFPLLNNS